MLAKKKSLAGLTSGDNFTNILRAVFCQLPFTEIIQRQTFLVIAMAILPRWYANSCEHYYFWYCEQKSYTTEQNLQHDFGLNS